MTLTQPLNYYFIIIRESEMTGEREREGRCERESKRMSESERVRERETCSNSHRERVQHSRQKAVPSCAYLSLPRTTTFSHSLPPVKRAIEPNINTHSIHGTMPEINMVYKTVSSTHKT